MVLLVPLAGRTALLLERIPNSPAIFSDVVNVHQVTMASTAQRHRAASK